MPMADDLFRSTSAQPAERARLVAAKTETRDLSAREGRRSSGRIRHDEKMTVYVTADELMEIEHARLALRRRRGVAIDRGRLVREAIAIALADLEENGDDSLIFRRLSAS